MWMREIMGPLIEPILDVNELESFERRMHIFSCT
jgi:hypothetical protein